MATKRANVVTGVKELDRALRSLDHKMQRKYVKKACREAAKKVKPRIESYTPVRYDVMRQAYAVRVTSRTIKRKTGVIRQGVSRTTGFTYSYEVRRITAEEYGAKVEVSRKTMRRAIGKAKGMSDKRKSKELERLGDDGAGAFYPAFVELGAEGTPGVKPMRRGAQSMRAVVHATFAKEMRKMVMEAGSRVR